MQDRRRKHPAFAVKWDAAVVFAQARLAKGRTVTLPRARARGSLPLPQAVEGQSFRTCGGEAVLVRLKNGTVQMRRAQAGKLTPAAEQAFLAAVSATCNLSLAAAAVGACFGAFNRRRRKDPAFARELRLALQQGYEALEMALLQSGLAGSHEHDDWRENDRPAIPPMTANQALQLMYLHQKEALMLAEPLSVKRRRGESDEAHEGRLIAIHEAWMQRQREAFDVAEAARWRRGEPAWGLAGEAVRRELGLEEGKGASRGVNPRDVGPVALRGLGRSSAGRPSLAVSSTEARLCDAKPPFCSAASALPDLAQVTGWSRADPAKAAHDPRRALFGGWRLEEMEETLRDRGLKRGRDFW